MDTIVVFDPAPGPVSAFTDDFNRSDEDLATSSDWSDTGRLGEAADFGVVSNRATTQVSGGVGAFFSFEGGTPADNQYAQAEVSDAVTTDTNQHQLYIIGRYTDADNYYWLEARLVGRWRLWKRVAGVDTEIADTSSATDPVSVTDLIRLECSGTTIRALINTGSGFSEVLSVTDSDLTSGKCGLGVQASVSATTSAQAGFDNFECGGL